MPSPTIALCMIVRNEAPIIERCLRSALPLIDTWVICDTGSGDGTPDIIRRWMRNVPGRLHSTRWRNFGHNRSELMRLARGSADYLLLLDADMTVWPQDHMPDLAADAYLLRHAGPVEFWVPRLVRGTLPWRFEGATHEYLTLDGAFSQERLDALTVVDHGDGSSRVVKLERDRRLLERALENDPDDARSTFYLAQTLRDSGRIDEAIALYDKRSKLGGWQEESFCARLEQARLVATRDWDAAVPLYLSAWHVRPGRAEPLYELARGYRMLGEYPTAALFADRARRIPLPPDILFVHREPYDWGCEFEHALASYWTGSFEEARRTCDALLASRRLPADRAHVAASLRDSAALAALVPSAAPSQRLHELVGVEFGEIALDIRPPWPHANPSIAVADDGFRMIVRTVNYLRDDDGTTRYLDDDGATRTLNYLVALDDDLRVAGVSPMVERDGVAARRPSPVQGFEDCRLVGTPAGWKATATSRDLNDTALCEIVLLHLEGGVVTRASPAVSPNPGRHEKNWMPFLVGGDLHVVYTCGPTVVLRLHDDGSTETVAWAPAPDGVRTLRGGSQGVEVEDGWLFCVHEAIDEGSMRSYLHRFVHLDRAFRITRMSPAFCLLGSPIEFVAGMASRADTLVLSFGVSDRQAFVARTSLAAVLGLLQPVQSPSDSFDEAVTAVTSQLPRIPGWCSAEKARRLMELVRDVRPAVYVEIGVFGGASLMPALHALRSAGSGVAYAIDPWSADAAVAGGGGGPEDLAFWSGVDLEQIHDGFVSALERDGLTGFCKVVRTTSERAGGTFADESIDILHIDGNHAPDAALNDVRTYLPKVRRGGYVWFDDTDWPSTRAAVAFLDAHCTREDARSVGGTCVLFRKRS